MHMDLRIVKTRQNIENSLLELLDTKEFKDITIQDILDKALINRSTFYRHYKDKYDLIEQIAAKYIDHAREYLNHRFHSENVELLSVVRAIYDYLYQDRVVITKLWNIKEQHLHFYQDTHNFLKEYCFAYLLKSRKDLQTVMADYYSMLYAVNVLATVQWLYADNHISQVDNAIDTLNIFLRKIST